MTFSLADFKSAENANAAPGNTDSHFSRRKYEEIGTVATVAVAAAALCCFREEIGQSWANARTVRQFTNALEHSDFPKIGELVGGFEDNPRGFDRLFPRLESAVARRPELNSRWRLELNSFDSSSRLTLQRLIGDVPAQRDFDFGTVADNRIGLRKGLIWPDRDIDNLPLSEAEKRRYREAFMYSEFGAPPYDVVNKRLLWGPDISKLVNRT